MKVKSMKVKRVKVKSMKVKRNINGERLSPSAAEFLKKINTQYVKVYRRQKEAPGVPAAAQTDGEPVASPAGNFLASC